MKKGFTLVELAVVLIIIGLIIVAVLQGSELVRQTQIRNAIRKISETDTAVSTFVAKFGDRALPGDFNMASQFGITKDDKGLFNTSSANDLGYNGDGDGVLDPYVSTTAPTWASSIPSFSGEIANFWVELSNVGILSGGYRQIDGCGSARGGPCSSKPGKNLPKLAIGNGLIAASDQDDGFIYYILGIGEDNDSTEWKEHTNLSPISDSLTPEDAWSIDSKIDDGKPETGIALVTAEYFNYSFKLDNSLSDTDCYSSHGGDYNMSLSEQACTLRIKSIGTR